MMIDLYNGDCLEVMKAIPDGSVDMVVSFSGGRSSAYMCYLLKQQSKADLYFVFANTGCEHEKTLEFVDKCDKAFGLNLVWLEAVVNHESGKGTTYRQVTFETASRNGEPYSEVVKKYGIPCVATPHCTRELKQAPINAWLRDNFAKRPKTAIGIRADEPKRIRNDKNIVYPLNELGVDKQDVLDFWSEQDFDLGLPEHLGNCVWCFKKSDTKILKALQDAPSYFEFVREMERQYPTVPITKKNGGNKAAFFRGGRMLSDFEQLAEITSNVPIQYITDGGCSESCEFLIDHKATLNSVF